MPTMKSTDSSDSGKFSVDPLFNSISLSKDNTLIYKIWALLYPKCLNTRNITLKKDFNWKLRE